MADSDVLESADSGGVTFQEGDLLAALEAAMRGADDGPADAFTVAELCERTGSTDYRIRKALLRLKQAGRLQVVHVKRLRLDDRAVLTAAYRWK